MTELSTTMIFTIHRFSTGVAAGAVGPGSSAAMNERRLGRLAARQLGLFTRAQAVDCGYSAFQIRRRVARTEWQQVCGPVLAFRGRLLTAPVLAAAAHLAVPGSVIAGPSAALWYDLPTGATGRWLWVGRPGRCRVPGVRTICDPLTEHDIRRGDGILITAPARTVFDCLRVVPDEAAMRLAVRALQRGWTTRGDLQRRIHEFAGRRGAPRLAHLMGTIIGDAESAAERLALGLLRRARITGWIANAEICDRAGLIGYGDIVFHAARLVVEIDGWAYHSDPDRFQRDRSRQNRLVAAGWTVLRFTWADLRNRPDEFVAAIRTALKIAVSRQEVQPH
jgi:very-short-patch-repair endonuclease